jgi:hypothetical protein
MLLIGSAAYVTRQPFIYPSLSPTAFLEAEYPFHRTSQYRDTTIGHLIAVTARLAVFVDIGYPIGGNRYDDLSTDSVKRA